MGSNSSKQTQEDISKTITNSLNKTVTNISNSMTNSALSTQEIELDLTGAVIKGNISLKQDSKVKMAALSKIDSAQVASMATELSNEISKSLAAASEQKNSGLNLGQVNNSEQNQLISTYVETNLSQIMETNLSNVITNTTSADQVVRIRAKYLNLEGNMIVDQAAVIESISDGIASTLVEQTLTAKSSNKQLSEMAAKSSQVNAGISLFGGLLIFIIIGVAAFYGYKMYTA